MNISFHVTLVQQRTSLCLHHTHTHTHTPIDHSQEMELGRRVNCPILFQEVQDTMVLAEWPKDTETHSNARGDLDWARQVDFFSKMIRAIHSGEFGFVLEKSKVQKA